MIPRSAFHILNRFAGGIVSVLAPPRCRFCNAALFDHANPFLCPACVETVPWIGDGACRGCGFPAGPHARHGDNCRRCRDGRLRLTAAAAVARYRGGARSLVMGLKYRGETELAEPMAGMLAERLRTADFGNIDLPLPVALHPARRRARGFDQAELLCRWLSRRIGLPHRPELVTRIRPTEPQARLHRDRRLGNMRGAFRVSGEAEGKSVLLIDDVMTTGATMAACAAACREAGARRVYGLVFAR